MNATAAPAAPRLTVGVIASVLLHGAMIAAFVFMRPGMAPPGPPVYRVRLVAAPPGERNTGVVQAAPKVPPVQPVTPVKTTPPKVTAPVIKPKPKPRPPVATPTPVDKPAEPPKKTAEPAPTAGAGKASGQGADVANVDTHGIEFPYPEYTSRIVNQLIKYFGEQSMTYVASVRFIIHRDGTVTGIEIVESSRNYAFDTRARGAVEAAGNAKAFGPLPAGFNEDILPVTFRFSPTLRR